MDDNIKRVEIFKLAVQLRTYQSLIQSQGVYKNIQSTLDHVDRSIDHAAAGFTEAQIVYGFFSLDFRCPDHIFHRSRLEVLAGL